MPAWDWQTPTALLCVLLAAAVLARRAWRLWKTPDKSGCGSCGSCPSGTGGTTEPVEGFVPLDSLK